MAAASVTFVTHKDEEVDGGSYSQGVVLEGSKLLDTASGKTIATRWYDQWTDGPSDDPATGNAYDRIFIQ